jgi:hypothetical protein
MEKDLMGVHIHGNGPHPQNPPPRLPHGLVDPSQNGLNPENQFTRTEGLRQIVVRAQLEALDPIFLLLFGRQDQDWYRPGGRFSAEGLKYLVARKAREHSVQDDQVRNLTAHGTQGVVPVGHRLHPKTLPCKLISDERRDVRFVLHHQNSARSL